MKKISATGYETSKELCSLGNKKLKNKILLTSLNEIYQLPKKRIKLIHCH